MDVVGRSRDTEGEGRLPQWCSELQMELWESPVLSYPLKHT